MRLLQIKALKRQLFALALLVACSLGVNANAANNSIIPRSTANLSAQAPAKTQSPKPKTSPKKLVSRIARVCTALLAAVTPAPVGSFAPFAKAEVTITPKTLVQNQIITPPAEPVATPLQVTDAQLKSILADAISLRTKYEEDPTPENKTAFDAKAREYIDALKKVLDAKSIKYVEEPTDYLLPNEKTVSWPHLTITTEGDHRLNRFSAGLKRRYDASLVVDFILPRAKGSTAAYFEKANAVIISEDALVAERATKNEIEEILHVKFAAERAERNKTVGHVPVQMYFVSGEPILGQGVEHDYTTEMTFEDIWAQATKISIAATQSSAVPADMAEVRQMIEYFVSMAETADLAIEKAKLSALEGQNSVLNTRADQSAYLVFGYEHEFSFSVFIPQVAATLENSGPYAVREINDAKKLMKFMREYFYPASLDHVQSDEELFVKALNFKGALYDFIQKMGRSQPTANADYNMVASLLF